jgi:integrase
MAKQRNPKGLGSYYKKDDLFCWKYVRDGKPIYRSSKTEKGLQEKVRKILSTGIANDKTKVKDYFETWLENDIRPLKKQATYEQYSYMYHQHIKPVIGDFKMTSIRQSDIQKVIATMNQKVYERKDKNGKVISTKVGTATKTMKHAKTVMNIAFTKAFRIDKIIPENPVHDIQIPHKQAKPRKTLTIEELILYFKSLNRSRWIWSAKFDLVTGVRRGELLALKWTDIDWENNRIVIDESNSSTGLGDTKPAKVHYVPLSNIAKSILINQMDMLKSEMNPITINDDNTFKRDLKGTDLLVFPTIYGTMIKPNTYYHTIKRFGESSGLNVHPHMFRHTWVYNMRKKLSLKELQEALGHDESTTTLDIYGAMINDTIDSTASQIDEVFSSIEAKIEEARAEIENSECKIIDFSARRKAK